MRLVALMIVVAGSLLSVPGADASLKCKPLKCPTAAPVEAARAIVERDCPCTAAASVKKYKKCAKQALKTAKQEIGIALVSACQKDVKAAINNATCGRTGFVPCNKRNKKDTKTTCAVVKTAKCKGSACGAFTSCADACSTAVQACATTSTTTTSTTTTTSSTLPICGDGIVNGTEQCDSPCAQGACGAGQICDGTCQCITPQTCACGAPDPTQMQFSTRPGMGNCGTVQDASNADLLALECGGLYFGGGPSAVTLPAVTPDNGTLLVNTCCSGTSLTLAATSQTDTGSQRTCSGEGCLFGAPLSIPNYLTPSLSTCVINEVARNSIGTAECTTGVVNLDLPLTSVVYLAGDLLNGSTANQPAVPGTQPCPLCTATCSTMECNNTATRTACTPGTEVADCGMAGTCTFIRPCTADMDCAGGGTCGGTTSCMGGPNHGNACAPATTTLGSRCQGGTNNNQACTTDADCPGTGAVCSLPYPTSHDCPAGGVVIGNLPIPFALTTGTASKTAQDINGAAEASGADRLFCGFCRDEDGSANFGICIGGDNAGTPCGLQSDCPNGTCGGEITCTSDDQCAQPREKCRQRDNGAFVLEAPMTTPQLAATISETGTPAGSLVDHAAHASTLVSVFCIPPTYSPIDAAASLPGPGAVALVGETQLLP